MNSAEKEAIATLNEHLTHWKRLLSEKICDQSEGEKTIDALQNAIKALEQEPCEDAVDRQAVNELVDELARAISDERCCISRGRSTATIMRDISHLPSVTPQPCEDIIIDKHYWKGFHNGIRTEKFRESKRQELCDDAISRQAAIVALDDRMSSLENVDMQIAMGFAKGIIHELPLVTPQPKMGKWRTVKHYGRDYYQCTYCSMERIDDHSKGWNYCPFCGAKMSDVDA